MNIIIIETYHIVQENSLKYIAKGLTLYGPNSFFRLFSGHNLR